MAGQRVLLVDVDPQGNLTSGVGQKESRPRPGTIYDALTTREPTTDAGPFTIPTAVDRSTLIPGGSQSHRRRNRAGAAAAPRRAPSRAARRRLRDEFDYIFIDCPPSLGLLTLNALVAADAVLIPLHCEYFALEGLADLVGTMRRVRAALNPALDIEGVLLTMFDERTNLGQQVANDVRQFFKEKVFRTVIPRNVRLGEAPSHGMPVILYDVKSRGRRGVSRATSRSRNAANAERPRRHEGTTRDRGHMHGKTPRSRQRPQRAHSRRARAAHVAAVEVDVDRLSPNDFQPRGQVDDARLDELAQSIKANGVIQPIVVRKVGDRFQIIAGERRWRAARGRPAARAGRRARCRAGQERSLLEMALIENIQRENLNPIDEALAYRRLTDEFQLTQEDIASAVGKDRASVANHLRLLKLPDEVRAKSRRAGCRWATRARCSRCRTRPISAASRAT